MHTLAPLGTRGKSDPTPSSTGTDPAGWRRWWADESVRVGTDWPSVLGLHLSIADALIAGASS
jgi:hypothetical protein